MSQTRISFTPFEYRADFEAPEPTVPPVEDIPEVRISAVELAALLEDARLSAEKLAAEGAATRAADAVEAFQTRLQGAMDDLIALVRHVEKLAVRGDAEQFRQALAPVSQRIVDGQADLIALIDQTEGH